MPLRCAIGIDFCLKMDDFAPRDWRCRSVSLSREGAAAAEVRVEYVGAWEERRVDSRRRDWRAWSFLRWEASRGSTSALDGFVDFVPVVDSEVEDVGGFEDCQNLDIWRERWEE
jgi:hypothetical protein